MLPRVSVILPAYNAATTLERTLATLLAQTWQDLELIAVDDGSLDRTVALPHAFEPAAIARWGPDRLRIVSQLNGGPSAARNAGARLARGHYLTFLDADDLWTEDKLACQVAAIEQALPASRSDRPAAVAYSWVDCIDEEEGWLRRGGHPTASGWVYPQMLLVDLVECGSNVLLTRQAFFAVGGFDEGQKTSEDWDLWLRLARYYAFVVVPEVQVLYRQRAASLSADVWQMERDSFALLRREQQQFMAQQISPPAQILAPQLSSNTFASLLETSQINRYKILAFDALEGASDRRRALTAARYLGLIWAKTWRDRRFWRSLLCHRERYLKLVIKVLAIMLLSRSHWLRLRDRWGSLRDPESVLLWSIQTQP